MQTKFFQTHYWLVTHFLMIEPDEKASKNFFEIDTDDNPIVAVVEFLDTHLPRFPASFAKATSSTKIEAEDKISQELQTYLQRIAWGGTFMFQFQRLELGSRRSSDFGVLTVKNYNSSSPSRAFFLIEAKRLPTPGTDKDGNSREKEYVEGNYGGIERYKRGHHGASLTDSALLGYIQDSNDCDYWSEKINSWIDALVESNSHTDIHWDTNDTMTLKKRFISAQKYFSKNARVVDNKSDSINLHHYLLRLKQSQLSDS